MAPILRPRGRNMGRPFCVQRGVHFAAKHGEHVVMYVAMCAAMCVALCAAMSCE